MRGLAVALGALLVLGACEGDIGDADAPRKGAATGVGGNGGGGGIGKGGPPDPITPSGYLLISEERLTAMRQEVVDNSPRWQALKTNVDEELGDLNIYNSSAANRALVYLLSGEQRYADAAYEWASSIVSDDDVQFDSYLYFGDRMREVALVMNYCGDALTGVQHDELAAYLDRWTNEIWFDNQGSGWGLADPGNNYHHAFLQGTAFAGYALKAAGNAAGDRYIELVDDKLSASDGTMAYLSERLAGGDWHEGSSYGERSKQRLFSTLSVVVSMGGTNYFYEHPYAGRAVEYALYQVQPGGVALYPGGDLARDSAMPVTPYERDYIQAAVAWMGSGDRREHGSWYIESYAPTYDEPGFRGFIFQDMVYSRDVPGKGSEGLPLSYRAEGTEWVNMRSGWDSGATSVSVSGSPMIDQSHAHHDVASFTIFKEGWLAVDATSYSHDGLNWAPDAHNMVSVTGTDREYGAIAGLVAFEDEGTYAYSRVDASTLFRADAGQESEQLLEEYTRELLYLRPNAVIVYDRVAPQSGSQQYEWRLHLANQPTFSDGRYQATAGGGGLSLVQLLGGSASVHQDSDLTGGSSDAWRIAQEPSGTNTRFLNVIEVASGNAPALTAQLVTASGMDGAVWQDQVVMFASGARGGAAGLPFSYVVSSAGDHTHTLVNMAQAVDVAIDKSGGQTSVTVSAGNTFAPSAAGVVRFSD